MNVFDLFAKIGLDTSEYDKGLSGAAGKLSEFGSKMASGFKTVTKIGTAAVGAASAAIGAMVKTSVDGYAEYEQLVGGVETLFGSSAKKVLNDANNAFKEAGMSANEYMETSIQSAAALINSLGGDQAKAADLMNMSITDMSDNVNKMGTSMEAVQNAYRGFSRGNFTMLDNLALGFAGTKEGMQELLDKAKEISGIKYDISSYADIVEAIHVVQTEMGITGTTAKEASSTIAGSLSAMKSAWQNLVTGMADSESDFDQLITNVVDSAETVLGNIMPIAEKALNGVITLIERSIPIFVDRIPALIEDTLPKLLNAGARMVEVITKGISQNSSKFVSLAIDTIKNILPVILKGGADIVFSIVTGISENIDALLDGALEIIESIGSFLMENAGKLFDSALNIILNLAEFLTENLPEMIPAIYDIIYTIVEKLTDPDMIMNLVDAALAIMIALAEGLVGALPVVIEKVPQIIANIVEALVRATPKIIEASIQMMVVFAAGIIDNLDKMITAGMEVVGALVVGVVEWFAKLVAVGADMGNKIREGFWDFIEAAKTWGRDLMENFISGITEKIQKLKEKVGSVAQTVKDLLGFSEPKEGPLSNFHTYAPDMMELFAKGITDNAKLLTDAVRSTFDIQPIIHAETNPAGQTAVAGAGVGRFTGDIIIPVYIGDESVQEVVVRANQINDYVSGGR